jgi:glycosyltransferase
VRQSEEPLVSIVVATYNAAGLIEPTIRSLANQTVDSSLVEIVVVDGASTDDTVERIRASGLSVVLRSAPDQGIYDAMNIGARLARGRWIQFLNAGDVYSTPKSLEYVIEVLQRAEPTAAWAVGGAQNMHGGQGPSVPIRNLPFNRRRHLLGLQPHCHQACWFSRDKFLSMGGHDLAIGIVADYDLITRFAKVAPPLEIRRLVIDYLGGGISEVPARQIAKRLHDARVQRSGAGAVGATADLALTTVLGSVNAARVHLGRLRRRLQSRVRGR